MYRWICQCNEWGSVTCFPQQQLENSTKPKIVSFGYKPNVSITTTTQNRNTIHKRTPYSVYRSRFSLHSMLDIEGGGWEVRNRYALWPYSFSYRTQSLQTSKQEIITLEC